MADFLHFPVYSSTKNVSLPVELIEDICKHAIDSSTGKSAEDHLIRQKTAFALMLTCKVFSKIVQPLLYNRVVLVHDRQLARFEVSALTTRGAESVSTHTKAIWVLCDSFSFRFGTIARECRNVEHLVLKEKTIQLLKFIPTPSHLRELTIIDPFDPPKLQSLNLQRLHIIATAVRLHGALANFPATVAIPFICIEVTDGDWNSSTFSTVVLRTFLQSEHQGRDPNRIWLKVHATVRRNWKPSDVLSRAWWTAHNHPSISQDSLDRLKVTIVDKDGSDPTNLEKSLRAIDYNASHWVGSV